MPQLDLDHLFCVGARGSGFTESMPKVACETAAELPDANAGAVELCGRGGGAGSTSPRADDDDADAPAESVLLRVPDGVGLTHLFGAALRRDGSTKGSSNPKAAAEAAATRKGAPRAADSRRLPATTTPASSSKTAAVVIGGLPASKVVATKERRARARAPGRVVVARAWRRPAAGARVFASEAVAPEPVSPKVSCFGAVLSEERSAAAAPAPGTQEEEEEGNGGCWASLKTALLGLCRDSNDLSGSEPISKPAVAPESQRAAVMISPALPVAAGLGDVKRLASRRWPETMALGTV